MSFVNRCIWSATAGGLSDFVVSVAALGGYTPATCLTPTVQNGANYEYFAILGSQHEEGTGTYTTSTTTLARTTIRNSSTGGAKVNFIGPPIVYMGGSVANNTRERLNANRTYYVRTDGSDSNSGLANTAAGAFLTWNFAYETVVCGLLDTNAKSVTLQGTAGQTFTSRVNPQSTWVGGGSIIFDGGTCSVAVTDTEAIKVNTFVPGGGIFFQNFTVSVAGTSGTTFMHTGAGYAYLAEGMIFGGVPAGYFHIVAQGSGAQIYAYGTTISIIGDAEYHAIANGKGCGVLYYPGTTAATGTRTFNSAFISATNGGYIEGNITTFTGTFVGKRFISDYQGQIQTYGSGITYYPGTIAGTADAATFALYS